MNLDEFLNAKIPIVEIFNSISGEGITQGKVMSFVRAAGCNLRCSYCDTTYSYNESSSDNMFLKPDEIVSKLKDLNCRDVLYTGGEPLEISKPKRYIPIYLASKGFNIRIETNGSCEIYENDEISIFSKQGSLPINYVLDIKCPSSGMSYYNIFERNFKKLGEGDEIKFVVSNEEDINYALEVINDYKDILSEVTINFSPVFQVIESKEIAQMLIKNNKYFNENNLKTRISLQIHKYMWPPETRGV